MGIEELIDFIDIRSACFRHAYLLIQPVVFQPAPFSRDTEIIRATRIFQTSLSVFCHSSSRYRLQDKAVQRDAAWSQRESCLGNKYIDTGHLICYKRQPNGAVAQLGERLNGIQEVVSSILISSTI